MGFGSVLKGALKGAVGGIGGGPGGMIGGALGGAMGGSGGGVVGSIVDKIGNKGPVMSDDPRTGGIDGRVTVSDDGAVGGKRFPSLRDRAAKARPPASKALTARSVRGGR
jgi:hypothetical protein